MIPHRLRDDHGSQIDTDPGNQPRAVLRTERPDSPATPMSVRKHLDYRQYRRAVPAYKLGHKYLVWHAFAPTTPVNNRVALPDKRRCFARSVLAC